MVASNLPSSPAAPSHSTIVPVHAKHFSPLPARKAAKHKALCYPGRSYMLGSIKLVYMI